MAAGLIYTMGGSFWEFGGPDLERAKLFVMLGTAEDHHSNPMKIELLFLSIQYALVTPPLLTNGFPSKPVPTAHFY
jgi:anaerobic selenocysteine-containing dehydrogenase